MTVLTEWPWKVGYKPTVLVDPEGALHKAWCRIEHREPEYRSLYPGAEPQPFLREPLAHVAVTQWPDAARVLALMLEDGYSLEWRLRVLEGQVTLHITEIDLDTDGVVEFAGPIHLPTKRGAA